MVPFSRMYMGDRYLSSAGTGKNCALSMRVPNPSPVLDKNRAPMGPEILSSTGAGVWRKAPKGFPDSSFVLDKFQFARTGIYGLRKRWKSWPFWWFSLHFPKTARRRRSGTNKNRIRAKQVRM